MGTDDLSKKAMKIGDNIGEWTLKNLEITYNKENKIQMLKASFEGKVTLKGRIERDCLVEDGYDFIVSEEDTEKMPCYISDEMGKKEQFLFGLNIPENIENAPNLQFGEKLNCSITISDYTFIFAYMTAPNYATVVKIDV